jgi:hypothetical protein
VRKDHLQKQHIQVKIFAKQNNLDLVVASFKNFKKIATEV